MELPVVELISGTETPVGTGVTGAQRALVRYPDGNARAAIVKRMDTRAIAAECFCSLLLRRWGLNVPDPAIVGSPPMAFACIDVSYPNLLQRVGWSANLPPEMRVVLEHAAAKLVASFAQTPLALAADEAIKNLDRNLGNILWNGNDVAWVDHERALDACPEPMADVNKLAALAVMSGEQDRIAAAAVTASFTLSPIAVAEAERICSAGEDSAGFAAVVSDRLRHLANAVLARFPRPSDLLEEIS
ncbi:hypothetical protein C8C95_0158 [Acidovorax sp. 99]|nr:hypothetical protein C8C95_0158 [Acidovorax sp. 99]